MRNRMLAIAGLGCALLLSGCPKGNQDFSQAKKAEALQDYDTALIHYEKALKSDPRNTEYKMKATRLRFEAGQYHVQQGQKLREKGDLQLALAEFQKALAIDPASAIAEQEVRQTMELIGSKRAADDAAATPTKPPGEEPLAERPPELKPLSRAPYNLIMTNDAKVVFETIGKLAGIGVIFDPDFPARRISTQLTNVTLEQALEIVSLQSKAFWKPVTSNIIFVAPDQPAKRNDYEEQIVRTFYLHNTVQAQDLTEIVTGLRSLVDLKRVQQVNSQNAIIIRDTPDKLALAEKIIQDVDKAKPEVIIQVEVLRARVDRARDLGIEPGGLATLAFTPAGTTTTPSGGTGTGSTGTTPSATSVALNQLKKIGTKDYSVTLPGATAKALLTDSATKVIQNPEIRIVDGQSAKLKIGDRIPVATGSFQAGVGIGGATAGGLVNPLVNTQFQYIDTGVNLDITPRIHPNHEVSLKVSIEISSATTTAQIGGISQPVISQNKIEHDVRLHDGEVNILGGLIDRTETKNLSGWPGLQKIPFFRYFFSNEHTALQEEEILIVLIPRIVRMPEWTAENLRTISSGTFSNTQVRRESSLQAPPQPAPTGTTPVQPPVTIPPNQPTAGTNSGASGTRLRFAPQSLDLKPGETATIGIVVEDVKDLFSIPMLLQYDPKVISVEEVRHGGFLSGGEQEIAIVQRVDKEKGQAIISATRQPNTPGVSGNGTLVGIVVRGLAAGTSTLSIVQVNAHDSQQNVISFVTGEASIRVQP